MSQKQQDKEEVYKSVLNAAIELEIQLGHLKWTYTLLSKKSKVSRPLIYYYFGKEKINIVIEACNLFGQILAGTTKERMQAWEDGNIEDMLEQTRVLLSNYPYLTPYYFLYRNKDNEVGHLIRKYEQDGFTKRKKFFPKLNASEQRIMFAFHLGLVTFPHIEGSDIKNACSFISKLTN